MVMTMRAAAGVTRDEWERLEVPTGYRAEMIQGELVVSPSPTRPHIRLQVALVQMFSEVLPEGHEILFGIEWQIDSHSPKVAKRPQPDLIIASIEEGPVVGPPLFAMEILSPSDGRRLEDQDISRIQGKRMDYADAGLQHYVEIEQNGEGPWALDRYELHDGKLVVVQTCVDILQSEVPFPYEIDVPKLLKR